MASVTRTTQEQTITVNNMVKAGAVTAVIASIANLLILFIAEALFSVTAQFEVLNFSTVMMSSALGAVGGTIAFTLILQTVKSNAVRVFQLVAVVALLISLVGPINAGINGVPGVAPASLVAVLTMVIMHIIATVTIVVSLTTFVKEMD